MADNINNDDIYYINDDESTKKSRHKLTPQRENRPRKEKKPVDKSRRSMKIIKILWGSFLGLGLLLAVLITLIYNGVIGYMPPIEELEDPHDKLASVLYAGDGTTVIGRYYEGVGNRLYTEYDSISPYVFDALIATEDARFYSHSGVDFKALGRSGVKTILMGDKSSGGGSTITQQLAKQLYTKPSDNPFKRALQKPIEWMIAIKLERFYTKEEILNMYLNRFDFLNNAVGIKTAAYVYFGKEPYNLDVQEAAMLVGMLKNPSYYNPLRNPERTLERRNVVIDQMVNTYKKFYTQEWGDSVKQLPLGVDYHKLELKENDLLYVRAEVKRLMTAKQPVRPNRADYKDIDSYNLAYSVYNTDSTMWATDPIYGWIEKNPKKNGEKYNLNTDGLKIYTTIDLRMQQHMEDAVYEWLGGTLQPAFTQEKNGSKNGPYTSNSSELSSENVKSLIKRAIRQTERYRIMKLNNATDEEIDLAFQTKRNMDIFTYVKENGKWRPGTKNVDMTPYDSLLYMKTILRVGMMSMDPVNGHVKAYVGGPDFFNFQYDMVSVGRRQVGSTIKPYLYSLAMEKGYNEKSTFLNTQPRFPDGWAPRNSGGGNVGSYVTLKWALTHSNNWISARLLNELRPVNFVAKLRNFGITGYLDPVMPLCLGTPDVSVREMVAAYSAFANEGMRVNPIIVTRIEDNQGNVIYSATPHHVEVMSKNSCAQMLDMMISVVQNGTGTGLKKYTSALTAGKTGTTNYNSDTWFMGVTPELVTGVWVGGEERYIHFNTMALGQGARAALPLYGIYMRSLYNDPKLHYSTSARFKILDEGYSVGGSSGGGGSDDDDGESEEVDAAESNGEGVVEVSEGIFD